jgi:hypothetical protein
MYYDFAYYHYRNKNNVTALKFLEKSLQMQNNLPDALKLKQKILSENIKSE